MAPDVISLLLEIVQDVLVNLHMFHIKGTKLDASKYIVVAFTSTRSVTAIPNGYSPLA